MKCKATSKLIEKVSNLCNLLLCVSNTQGEITQCSLTKLHSRDWQDYIMEVKVQAEVQYSIF